MTGTVWSWIGEIDAEAWAAAAAWITAGLALVAGLVARGQLIEARDLRREQAQPYVVAFLESGPTGPVYIDLVVRNTGATAAHDVTFSISPAPEQSDFRGQGRAFPLRLPLSLPVLAPGQEWRTFWDTLELRKDTDLPSSHQATVSFADSRGAAHTYHYILDFAPLIDRGWMVSYGEHHAAEALRDIRSEIKKWRPDASMRGINVWVRDGEFRAGRRRDASARYQRGGQSAARPWLHRAGAALRKRLGR